MRPRPNLEFMATALYVVDAASHDYPVTQREVTQATRVVNLPDGTPAIVDMDNWEQTSKYAENMLEVSLNRPLSRAERLELATTMRDTALGFDTPNAAIESNQIGASVTYSREFEKLTDWVGQATDKAADKIGQVAGKAAGVAGNVAGATAYGFFSSLGGVGLLLVAGLVVYLYASSHVKLKTHTIL